MRSRDLDVQPLSQALIGWDLDLIVTGSIGAMESPRLVRALRRLGAEVHVWLTHQGSQFVTETSLAWASTHPVFSGSSQFADHIGSRKALVIAPASANFISKLAVGITDSPTLCLAASYLGQQKPILLLPNMHSSLAQSPVIARNISELKNMVTFLEHRTEEDKLKFPEPSYLADEIAHQLRKVSTSAVLTMGTTRGYIDAVRYISNYSTGALGSTIAEELYRFGIQTTVISGPVEYRPKHAARMIKINTVNELKNALVEQAPRHDHLIMAASVLDFEPTSHITGKISSTGHLKVDFKPTEKLLSLAHPKGREKIAFKLEYNINESDANRIARDYIKRYKLTMLIVNNMQDVSETAHKAWIFTSDNQGALHPEHATSKSSIAEFICKRILTGQDKAP